jgi:5-oxopent-3-ene-1,2,5-tricarboxylate decarboxylase/2-hydroxyhepta-2,4-diene-1,7-dioate isomerase
MKLARFEVNGRAVEGRVRDDGRLQTAAGETFAPETVRWLPPVVGTKAVGLALNYREHAAELSMTTPPEPALFFKPLSSLVGHRAAVVAPNHIEYMHYEVELVVVIGQRCRRVKPEHAARVIAGYTIGNDVTVRDFVNNFYRPPVKAKGWDTFGPLGPYMATPDEVGDPENLNLRTFVNGELRQQGNTRDMLRPVPELIAYITHFMTLEPGDTLWTGTPSGLSHVYPGDVMRLEIDGLGALENPIVADDPGEAPA